MAVRGTSEIVLFVPNDAEGIEQDILNCLWAVVSLNNNVHVI